MSVEKSSSDLSAPQRETWKSGIFCTRFSKAHIRKIVGLQYILDSGKKKDEGFARIGYCEFNKSNKDRKEVQIPHDNCNTGHEVQAIPNVLREEIWRSTSVAEI